MKDTNFYIFVFSPALFFLIYSLTVSLIHPHYVTPTTTRIIMVVTGLLICISMFILLCFEIVEREVEEEMKELERLRQIVQALQKPMTLRDLASEIGLSIEQTEKYVQKLREMGLVADFGIATPWGKKYLIATRKVE